MSDFGDDMRAWRQRKQAYRRTMIECRSCGYDDGYKIDPKHACPRCKSDVHLPAEKRQPKATNHE